MPLHFSREELAGRVARAAESIAESGLDALLRQRRREMIEWHLEARGIRDRRVLDAMDRVPRERFVPEHLARDAYSDSPPPIEHGQTISQPYIVALTAEAGTRRERRTLSASTSAI